ncbi:ATP-dependent DNA helicase PcrA [Pseudoclavibacter triregionum]|nr:ATP-dependent DNA helicase PcrA [Pseudoclavibacter triregionum]
MTTIDPADSTSGAASEPADRLPSFGSRAELHEAIATALAGPGERVFLPTDEQARVLDHVEGPCLVMAGAGSGKTHTMMLRILTLVVTGEATPSSILGLTFTRKATAELRERVESGLRKLRAAGLIPASLALESPEISTYNSYANAIYREYALLVGREPDSTLLDEASAWLLMRGLVTASDDERLASLDLTAPSIASLALELARAARDNGVEPERLARFPEEFRRILELPKSETSKPGAAPWAPVRDAVPPVEALAPLADLVAAYERRKRERGLIEFSDQVAGAAEIIRRSSAVRGELRARARHIILDEYQDTSAGQVELLAGIFRGANVMAVGDPKQAIYGWRGASPGTMGRFLLDFGGAPESVLTLSTSWRNDRRILDAANLVASPLPETKPLETGQEIPELSARGDAGDGLIELVDAATLEEEAEACAELCADALRAAEAAGDEAPSIAMLFRKRATMGDFASALAERGVPHRIVGLGGVLASPEVADLVCLLKVTHDPDAGSELIRLLAGARYRVGIADIAALHRLARRVARHTWRRQEAVIAVARGEADEVDVPELDEDEDFGASLLEALEVVGWSRRERLLADGFSEDGIDRLKAAERFIQELRELGRLSPVDLIDETIRRAFLDIEIEANPRSASRQRNLDAFVDAVSGLVSSGEAASLPQLLEWLETASERADLSASEEPAEPGTVQLLTVHAAKGLEWDLVVVPRLLDGDFPSAPRSSKGWLAKGVLPFELRKDAAALPRLEWRDAATQTEVKEGLAALHDQIKEDAALEERRLAYVAFTRARSRLVLACSPWTRTRAKASERSPYLVELAEATLLPELAERMAEEPALSELEPPAWGRVEHPEWPREAMPADALARARALAEAVRRTVEDAEGERGALGETPWDQTIDLLVAEAAERRETPLILLPSRLAASRFKDAITDPAEIVDDLRRPMPQKPYRATRLGTKFHAWVEERYASAATGGGDVLDLEGLEIGDEDRPLLGLSEVTPEDEAALRPLRETFLASRFADRTPVSVEQTIELRLGARTIVCKLDAVFENPDGTVEIVDWKTGRVPHGETAEWERQLQLALYTLAWSKHHEVPVERIRAILYYVADDLELAFDEITSEERLLGLLDEADERLRALRAAEREAVARA